MSGNGLPEVFARSKVQNLLLCFLPCACLQVSALLALLLLRLGGMSSPSSPHAGLVEKISRYMDLHQDEFVQVGETTGGHFHEIPFGV